MARHVSEVETHDRDDHDLSEWFWVSFVAQYGCTQNLVPDGLR